MAEDEAKLPNGNTRVNLSIDQLERTLDAKLENAMLRLQIELGNLFASKSDLDRISKQVREVQELVGGSINKLETTVKQQDEDIIALQQDKAGRDALSNQRRAFFIGGGMAVILQIISIGITLYLVTHAGK